MINQDKIEISKGNVVVEVDSWFEALRVVEWMTDNEILKNVRDCLGTTKKTEEKER